METTFGLDGFFQNKQNLGISPLGVQAQKASITFIYKRNHLKSQEKCISPSKQKCIVFIYLVDDGSTVVIVWTCNFRYSLDLIVCSINCIIS